MPGWTVIVNRAQARIDAAKLAALANTDENEYVRLYRRAHAAHDALQEFVTELNELAE